jgi:hypothetical protein
VKYLTLGRKYIPNLSKELDCRIAIKLKTRLVSFIIYIFDKDIVGMHALINVHEYHCIAIRMRCWLMDVYPLFSNGVLTVYTRRSRALCT